MARIYFYPDYVVPQYKLAPDLAAVLGIHTGGWGEWSGGRRCFAGEWEALWLSNCSLRALFLLFEWWEALARGRTS